MEQPDLALDRVLAKLLERAAADSALALEFGESESEFFRGPPLAAGAERELAARRHSEWFLLERYSEALQAVPIEVWAHESSALSDPAVADLLQALRLSHCGVFTVTRVAEGEGVWLQDLASGGEYPLREEQASHALQGGDLLVGRLFPIDDLLHRLSPAAGVFRDPRLVAAVQADLQRARENRRGVLRISQAELEPMFFGAPAASRPHAETAAWAREELKRAGLGSDVIETIFAALARAEPDPARLLLGVDDTLGELLDEIAFRTAADLERVRQALLHAWPALRPAGGQLEQADAAPDNEPGEAEVDASAAIAAFDRGRAAGRDLDELFDQLERDLGLEPDEDSDSAGAPDFPGVVGAMVVEFLWEAERELGAERAREFLCLQSFASFAEDIGVFEELSEKHLLLYSTVWVPEQGRLASGSEAAQLLDALAAFCTWAEEQQNVPLRRGFAPILADLRESLPRIVEVNRRHALPPEGGPRGELVEVVSAAEPAAVLLARDARGREHTLPPPLCEQLQPGDRLRGEASESGELRALCCYPPESALVARPNV